MEVLAGRVRHGGDVFFDGAEAPVPAPSLVARF